MREAFKLQLQPHMTLCCSSGHGKEGSDCCSDKIRIFVFVFDSASVDCASDVELILICEFLQATSVVKHSLGCKQLEERHSDNFQGRQDQVSRGLIVHHSTLLLLFTMA